MKQSTNKEIIKALNKVSPISMQEHQLPVVWAKAKDYTVTDIEGKTYIDFTSSIFVANSGHSNTDILNAMRKKLNQELIHSYTFATKIRLKFLQELTSFTGYDKAFLLSSGTEAVEAACKIMKWYGLQKWAKSMARDSSSVVKAETSTGLSPKKHIIYSIAGSMHGKSMLAEQLKCNGTSLTGINDSIINLPYPKNGDKFLSPLSGSNVCGIFLESYRGWNAELLPIPYVQSLMKWAKDNDVLVCFDEIQAGFGRTGKLFAYEYYKIRKPDLVCCGKGLGGGVPISAVLGRKELLDLPDDLSSTNSGNPLVCAAALANIEYIKTYNLIKKSYDLGRILNKRLGEISQKYDIITGYNSIGLVGALIFANELLASSVCYKAMNKGLLLVKTGRESIKIGPPLVITKSALLEGLDIVEKSIKESNKS